MSKDEAIRLALETLEEIADEVFSAYDNKLGAAILALREALAEDDSVVFGVDRAPAQQEPVAWMWRCNPYCNWPEWSVSLKRPADSGRDGHKPTEGYEDMPLYTSPPAQRKPLTDEQIAKEVEAELTHYWNGEYIDTTGARDQLTAFARAIEAAHGIKGDA